MAVLVEALSVVIRAKALLAAFRDDWTAFVATVPNATLCADGDLVRVGFMTPGDVRAYVDSLVEHGLVYLVNGVAQDIVVVDQLRGPLATCQWIEFGHVGLDGDPKKRVAACQQVGSVETKIICPDNWIFSDSLSASFGFVPGSAVDKSLVFIRHDDGVDVYRSALTGEEVFVANATNRRVE